MIFMDFELKRGLLLYGRHVRFLRIKENINGLDNSLAILKTDADFNFINAHISFNIQLGRQHAVELLSDDQNATISYSVPAHSLP